MEESAGYQRQETRTEPDRNCIGGFRAVGVQLTTLKASGGLSEHNGGNRHTYKERAGQKNSEDPRSVMLRLPAQSSRQHMCGFLQL